MDIRSKVALVTGAASGIGRASALGLAHRGAAAVLVADVDGDGGEETAALVKDAGADAVFVRTDVTDPVSFAAAFSTATDRFGRLDIVHNNAGIVSGDPPWPDTPIEVIQRVVSVNALGPMLGTKLGIDVLSRSGGGAIVNTASIAALSPLPNDPVYAATKAAIVLFTQSCAEVAKTHGVRVNAVLPGMVDTSMIPKTGDGSRPAEWLAPMLGMIDLLDPVRVADAVAAFVEDDTKAGQTTIVMNDFRSPAAP